MTTKIEWTDEVWNVVTGCTPAGAGCANCYAKRLFPRVYGRDMVPCTADEATNRDPNTGQVTVDIGAHAFLRPRRFADVQTHPERLDKPLHWRKARRVFVCSMGDLFHEDVPDDFIAAVFGVMAACPRHIFQVLTKRPERARAWFDALSTETCRPSLDSANPCFNQARFAGVDENLLRLGAPWPLPNIWLGASVSTRADLDRVMRDLPHVPAAVHFISYEPALEAINARPWLGRPLEFDGDPGERGGIDWVVVGGESGPKARCCDIAWIRSVAEQCKAADVPCFVKQLGINPGRRVGKVWHPWFGEGKRNDPSKWPKDLRLREMPQGELK